MAIDGGSVCCNLEVSPDTEAAIKRNFFQYTHCVNTTYSMIVNVIQL